MKPDKTFRNQEPVCRNITVGIPCGKARVCKWNIGKDSPLLQGQVSRKKFKRCVRSPVPHWSSRRCESSVSDAVTSPAAVRARLLPPPSQRGQQLATYRLPSRGAARTHPTRVAQKVGPTPKFNYCPGLFNFLFTKKKKPTRLYYAPLIIYRGRGSLKIKFEDHFSQAISGPSLFMALSRSFDHKKSARK